MWITAKEIYKIIGFFEIVFLHSLGEKVILQCLKPV